MLQYLLDYLIFDALQLHTYNKGIINGYDDGHQLWRICVTSSQQFIPVNSPELLLQYTNLQ